MPNRQAHVRGEAPSPARTGRRLVWTLWPALIIYVGLVVWRAHGELTANDAVDGLFRTWNPPQTLEIGELFDPRKGALIDEIDTRFESRGTHPTDDSIDAWRVALRARGFHTTTTAGPGEGDARLIFLPDGPWLIVQRAHNRFVTFDPRRGMILMHEGAIAPKTPALQFERRPL